METKTKWIIGIGAALLVGGFIWHNKNKKAAKPVLPTRKPEDIPKNADGEYHNVPGLRLKFGTPSVPPGIPGTGGTGPVVGGGLRWTFSDARLKNDIQPMEAGALHKIMQLTPCSYSYNNAAHPSLDADKQTGFLAQELQAVAPHLVQEQELDGKNYLAVNYDAYIAYLTKAIQEQQREIEGIKAKLN